MLKRQPWMKDGELITLERRLLNLKDIVKKDHPLKDDFMKHWTARFMAETYRLEGEILDPECCQNAMEHLALAEPLGDQTMTELSTAAIKKTHALLLPQYVGNYRTKEAYAGYHMFDPASTIAYGMEAAVAKFNKADGNPILAASQLFLDVINIHPFPDGNGRLCRLLLSWALVHLNCSIFPVLLSSFHRKSRQHCIQAIRKPHMFYTLVACSVVKVWDEFENYIQQG